MGYSIANELAELGANVILVSGPSHLQLNNKKVKIIQVMAAHEMFEACTKYFPISDAAIMSAAVADFTPNITSTVKIRSGDKTKNLNIELKPTHDIAFELGQLKKENQKLIGFALETNDEEANAFKKLNKKNLDFIVLNSLNDPGAGFGYETNKISILFKNNKRKDFELKSKHEVAKDIINELIRLF